MCVLIFFKFLFLISIFLSVIFSSIIMLDKWSICNTDSEIVLFSNLEVYKPCLFFYPQFFSALYLERGNMPPTYNLHNFFPSMQFCSSFDRLNRYIPLSVWASNLSHITCPYATFCMHKYAKYGILHTEYKVKMILIALSRTLTCLSDLLVSFCLTPISKSQHLVDPCPLPSLPKMLMIYWNGP